MILDEKLDNGEVIVLDGAIGSEIECLSGKMDEAAWCATANVTDPDTVRRVHESYLRAGVDVITTNTFTTSRHVLEAAGLGDDTVAINKKAVELAKEARENVAPDRPVAIAGSMSNTLAWLPGTVGTDPDRIPTSDVLAANYREMANSLAEAGCDLLTMEMLLETTSGRRIMEAALSTGLPVWTGVSATRGPNGQMVGWRISYEEPDGRLADDFEQEKIESLEKIIDEFGSLQPQVIGIMHSALPSTTRALEMLFDRWDGPVMVYPEAHGFDSGTREPPVHVTLDKFASHCREWVENGVQIIGGCCGTTVHHIAAMVDQLPDRPGPRPH